ncbi:hypothetical protein ACFZBM_04550 [Streptomyces lavendulae]|uniref:Uncharacterized protein n=1 Tax=Streptomyces lavendulae subsp. lavendulae TaxID=58340 RepID=A0A2K8P740_STRLA|nr:hypothetical protein [Streptomyces lavendulae]ATZ22562.1 hypothetical protein SLAV_03260 [Streptomyces lavendulae subsp. lavendulae]QUQ52404.1 hypothetical protein SLLC_01295 [Streptomyces lavendulae subsp. lavendulae]
MPTTLPVPIEFHLPDGWLPAHREAFDPGVAFAAVHPRPDAGFAANITIDGGFPPEGATLVDLADDSVQRLREVAESVQVVQRRQAGPADSPALTQRVTFSAVAGDVRRDLVQSQVFLALVDTSDPGRRAVLRLALTATAAQHDAVVADFRSFVRSVRPDSGEGEGS